MQSQLMLHLQPATNLVTCTMWEPSHAWNSTLLYAKQWPPGFLIYLAHVVGHFTDCFARWQEHCINHWYFSLLRVGVHAFYFSILQLILSYGLDILGFKSWQGQQINLFNKMGTHPVSCSLDTVGFFPGFHITRVWGRLIVSIKY